MENLLRCKKINETPFRKDVLAIFSKYNNAISLSIIEKELVNYNRITLYRTIKIFLLKGIIHEITISGTEKKYAICQKECNTITHHHQHIHFKCNKCSIIFCVDVDEFPKVVLPKYKIEQLEIQASGLCKNCNI